MSDEYFTLLVGQFVERKLQLIQKHVADVERFRPGIGRWQQIFDLQQLAAFPLKENNIFSSVLVKWNDDDATLVLFTNNSEWPQRKVAPTLMEEIGKLMVKK